METEQLVNGENGSEEHTLKSQTEEKRSKKPIFNGAKCSNEKENEMPSISGVNFKKGENEMAPITGVNFKKREKEMPPITGVNLKKGGNKDVIDAVNYLQHKLIASGQSKLDLVLPQIVAVGKQSAGKSSVLESFVGREFLPRGKGTVTRRPTILQMNPANEEYVIFGHKPGVIFTDFNKVREEIESETARHPGPTGFTSDPITLQIFSPRVLKLTIVDLPGIIKNVEDGDDETNILEVRNMILQYITPEESLILAVTSATENFLTSEAMEIAKEVDPQKKRTIGVITKLDCLNGDDDYRKVLENRAIYLTMGYVGVVNRSQKEIEQKRDIDFILNRESEFFANHPEYKHLKDTMGIPYLKKMLQKTLRGHIKKFLPQKRNDIYNKLSQLRKDLKSFYKRVGNCNMFNGQYDKQDYVIQLILNFAEDISVQLFGNSLSVDNNNFSAGAIISFKLATKVHKNLSLKVSSDEEKAQFILVNILGIRTSISVPSMALDALNSILLEQYKGPMEDSVTCIKEILALTIAKRAETMDKYPSLKNEILHQIQKCIEIEAENTKDKLIDHIDGNMGYINYNHPDFDISTCSSLAPSAGPLKLWENSGSDNESFKIASEEFEQNNDVPSSGLPNTETIMEFLKHNESNMKNVKYATAVVMKNIEYVQKQLMDVSIKYIINFLIKRVMKFIKTELLSRVLRSPNFASLSEDCEADFYWKEETEISCQLLQDVLDAIQDF